MTLRSNEMLSVCGTGDATGSLSLSDPSGSPTPPDGREGDGGIREGLNRRGRRRKGGVGLS